jgi:hypothetical protein
MRRIPLGPITIALVASSATISLAQELPASQPKFLHIIREEIKVGRAADHSKWEAGWPAAFEKSKSPNTYIALAAVTGAPEVWYVSPYASQAAFGEAAARDDADAVLTAELDRLAKGDAEFVHGVNAMQAVARPELSHGAFPDLAMMRFWEIGSFQVKPGHDEEFEAAVKAYAASADRAASKAAWRTYQVVAGAPDGTYLFFSSVKTYGDFDKAKEEGDATFKGLTYDERSAVQKLFADGTVSSWTNRFRLDPVQSYVPMETRQKDPAFWMPKPAAKAAAKPPAKKP